MKGNKQSIIKSITFAVLALALPISAHAEGGVAGILENIAQIGPAGVLAITAIAYLMGAAFAVMAVLQLTKMTNDREDKGPLMGKFALFLIAAVFAIALPQFLETGEETVFGGDAERGSSQGFDQF